MPNKHPPPDRPVETAPALCSMFPSERIAASVARLIRSVPTLAARVFALSNFELNILAFLLTQENADHTRIAETLAAGTLPELVGRRTKAILASLDQTTSADFYLNAVPYLGALPEEQLAAVWPNTPEIVGLIMDLTQSGPTADEEVRRSLLVIATVTGIQREDIEKIAKALFCLETDQREPLYCELLTATSREAVYRKVLACFDVTLVPQHPLLVYTPFRQIRSVATLRERLGADSLHCQDELLTGAYIYAELLEESGVTAGSQAEGTQTAADGPPILRLESFGAGFARVVVMRPHGARSQLDEKVRTLLNKHCGFAMTRVLSELTQQMSIA